MPAASAAEDRGDDADQDLRPRRLERLDRGAQQPGVGLVVLAFHVDLAEAHRDGVVGALRRLDVALVDGDLVAVGTQRQQLASSARRPCVCSSPTFCELPRLSVEAPPATRRVSAASCLFSSAICASSCRRCGWFLPTMLLMSLSFVSRWASCALRPCTAPLPRTSGEVSPPVLRCRVSVSTRSACAAASCADQHVEARVLLVEPLVGDDDALGLLELRQPRLGALEVGAQRLHLIVEEGRRLARRRDPQLDRDVLVGLGEGVRRGLREDRISGGEAEVDDAAAAAGLDRQAALQDAGEIALERDLRLGRLAPLRHRRRRALDTEDLDGPRRDSLAPQDLDLRRHVARRGQRRRQRAERRIDPHLDDQRGLRRVLARQQHRRRDARRGDRARTAPGRATCAPR